MRIPNRIMEHPIEAVIASLLLLGLLFGSVDLSPAVGGGARSGTTVSASK